MLEIRNMRVRLYGSPIAVDVSIKIPNGEIIGLFGENGAGKSTLMKSVFGFYKHKGEVLIDGEPLSKKNIARLSFATCEHSFFPNLTLEDHKAFLQDQFPAFKSERFEALIDFFKLSRKTPLKHMSVGQQNQAELILALSQGADYIFMDEPFVGNDIFNREDFYKVLLTILEENETIILSTHLIEEVDNFVGRAFLMKEGKIIDEITTDDLDERGVTLKDYIKEKYEYDSNRAVQLMERCGK